MHNKIQYSPLALKDLDEIWDYITNELMNPSAADNTVNGIMDMIDGLDGFPETGSRLHLSRRNGRYLQGLTLRQDIPDARFPSMKKYMNI